MPNPEFLEDEVIEAILSGRQPAPAASAAPAAGPGLESLVEFARDVRTVADRPVPRPSASLAAVLSAGFSTEKGDLLVTAASNVPGPATTQVAGLPKWRKSDNMLPTTGLLSGLSGLVAKIVAGVTAGLAGLTAAGAAGALPGPAQDAVASVINLVSPFTLPDGDTSASLGAEIGTNPAGPGVDISLGTPGLTGTPAANVTAGANTASGKTSTSVSAGVTTPAGGSNANLGGGTSTPLPSIPGLPNLENLPVPVPQCVKDIIDLRTGQPKVPLDQIATQVTACVRSLMNLSTAQLPVNTNQCISAVLNLVTSVGANPGSVPNLAGFDVSQCVPVDVSKCMSSVMNLMQNLPFGSLGSFGLGGSAGTGGASASATTSGIPGIPGLSGLNLDGCIPFDLDACLSSLLSMAGNLPGVPTGGIPGLGSGTLPSLGNLDLSACVPVGSLGSLPGLGSLSGFLPR